MIQPQPTRSLHSSPTRLSSDLTGIDVPGPASLTEWGSGCPHRRRFSSAHTLRKCAKFQYKRASCTIQASRIVKSTTRDRKSTRLNSSHITISYAVFCLKKKNDK